MSVCTYCVHNDSDCGGCIEYSDFKGIDVVSMKAEAADAASLRKKYADAMVELASANEAIDAYTEWDRQTRYSKLHGEHCECPLCEHIRCKYPKKEG